MTKVRVEAKSEVRDWDVGILTEILHNVQAESSILKRAMVVSKEETKEKAKISRAEEEAEERASKKEEEAALQDMIQAKVEYWESQEEAMIEEYARENSEDETEAETMMREKAKGVEIARSEAEAKAGPKMI